MEYQNELDRRVADFEANYLPTTLIYCVIFGFHGGELKVLLLRWKGTNHWSLPGGRIGNQEDMEAAAHRSLCERTGLNSLFLQQFHTFGNVERYTQVSLENTLRDLGLPDQTSKAFFRRFITVGYYALVEVMKVVPTPDFFTEECRWWAVDQLPALLFDHNEMVALALKTLRRQLNYQPIGYTLLPDKFTMSDLQQLYETILSRSLDRRNFEKRMLGAGILERLAERRLGGAHTAPYLYQFNKANYDKALETERMFVG